MKDWIRVCKVEDILENGGGCVKVNDRQIAIFNFERKEWYAVDNQCPHKQQAVLSRGLIGQECGQDPKVACPLHKNTFSLKTGKHLGGNENWTLKTYPVKVEGEDVYLIIGEEK